MREEEEVRFERYSNASETLLIDSFYSCSYPLWASLKGNTHGIFQHFHLIVSECSKEDILQNIDVDEFPSSDKVYWGIHSKNNEKNVLVTLGTPNDSEAVQSMRITFRKLTAYGTSAYDSNNSNYDYFYNYVIGVNDTGLQTIYGVNKTIIELKYLSAESFFKDVIKEKLIDMLWMNLEGGEFSYWTYFSEKTGQFDKLGITVCQVNLEIDRDDTEFYRYRKSVFYYSALLIVVLFLIVNFLSYGFEKEESNSKENVYEDHPRNIIAEQESGQKLPFTTTPSPPLIPYKYEELPICDLTTDSPKPLHDAESIVNEFFKCASMILLRFSMNPQGMLFNWPYTIYVCDEEDLTSRIPLRSFDNGQRQYWAVLPNCQEKTTLVTLGASENSKSEEDIRSLLKDFESFGIDPFHGKNSAYDKFNQVALSTDSNKLLMSDSNDKYSDKNYVATMHQQKFFNETVGVKKIDMLWINPNAGNFEYEKFLNKDGEFEKMGIKVCQVNIEITKNDAEKWSKLITPLVQEKRFIFMRPLATEGGELTRTYLLNVADPECVRKYLH